MCVQCSIHWQTHWLQKKNSLVLIIFIYMWNMDDMKCECCSPKHKMRPGKLIKVKKKQVYAITSNVCSVFSVQCSLQILNFKLSTEVLNKVLTIHTSIPNKIISHQQSGGVNAKEKKNDNKTSEYFQPHFP